MYRWPQTLQGRAHLLRLTDLQVLLHWQTVERFQRLQWQNQNVHPRSLRSQSHLPIEPYPMPQGW